MSLLPARQAQVISGTELSAAQLRSDLQNRQNSSYMRYSGQRIQHTETVIFRSRPS